MIGFGLIVGARQAVLSISITADLLGLSCTTASRVYAEKTSLEQLFSRQKCHVMREISKKKKTQPA